MNTTYTYDELGFGPIHLDGGVERIETEWGPSTAYERVDELHKAIALAISRTAFPVDGKVLRFLRQTLGLTQKQFGEREGYQDGQMVGLWEKGVRAIPESVINNLRVAVRSHLDPQAPIVAVLEDIRRPASELKLNFRNGTWTHESSALGGWARIQELLCAPPYSVGLPQSNTSYHDSPESLAA